MPFSAALAVGDAENAILNYEAAQELGGDSTELESRLKTLDNTGVLNNDLESINYHIK